MNRGWITGQRLVGLFLLGCMLFNYPLLSLFNHPVSQVFGIPLLYAYAVRRLGAADRLDGLGHRAPARTEGVGRCCRAG